MGKIDIESLTEGMVLEDPVKDLHGRVLMKEGSLITEKSAKILKMWGVVEVTVVDTAAAGEQVTAVKSLDPRVMELAENEAKVLFRHTDRKNQFVDELFRLATLRIAKARSKEVHNAQ
ncbi:MAG: hypothetical protein NTU47_16225 [Ignavibacteriales bacterium]|nr:hypothetical protein [Ignavibacteriales bacterium]